MSVDLRHAGAFGNKLVRVWKQDLGRSHALRGNAAMDAPRPPGWR